MRLPIRALAGHLAWSRDGSVWAVWRVEPTSYPYLSTDEKLSLHGRLRAALMALPPQSMLLSVCRQVDPGEVVQQMIDGVDLETCSDWRVEAAATLDELLGAALYERRHYLAVQLRDHGWRAAAGGLAAAATAVAERFALPAAPLRRGEVDARQRQAKLVEARLTRVLPLRRVEAGEFRWLYARAFRRGCSEPYLDESWGWQERLVGAGDDARMISPSLHTLAEATFFEGGSREDLDRPAHRRYLRVETASGVGYQTFAAVADMPREWLFPGGAGEWFCQLDRLGFAVDWCARITAVGNQDAQVKARKQARQLAGQFEQYEGEVSGAPTDLAEAARGVDAERAELAANKGEPELQTTLVLALCADNLADLEGQAEQLMAMFTPADYGLARPTGGQLALLTAILPGSPQPPVARDYTQYLLARDLASGAPFTGHQVGDPRGLLLGISLDGASPASDGQGTIADPVLFDPAWGPSVNRSGSVGVVGSLGSGKSYCSKRVMHAVVARGGQVVTVDRTEVAEYVTFAQVTPGCSQVVNLAPDSPVCLDPLRIFAGEDRVVFTIGFLTLLTQVSPSDLEGTVLAETVRSVAGRAGGTLGDVLAELEAAGASDPEARVVARKVGNYARNPLAALAFNPGQQLLALDADYIVFHTPGLSLPRREELLTPHLARQLLPEQLLAQALLYLVAAIARKVTLADPARFGMVVLDEAWSLTSSPQGRQLLVDLIRDGRKHNAAVWLASQHPDDLGDDQLTHLLGSRLVFRHDRGAIPAAVRFLGAEDSPAVAEALEELANRADASGQCLYRDTSGRLGRIQVLAARAPLHSRFDTNPATAHLPSDHALDESGHGAMPTASAAPDEELTTAADPTAGGGQSTATLG